MALGLFVIFASGALAGGGGGLDGGGGKHIAADDGLSALLEAADSMGGGEAGAGLDALLGEMEAMGAAAEDADADAASARRRAQYGRPQLYTGSQSMTTIPEPQIVASGVSARDVLGTPGDGYWVDTVNLTLLNRYDTLAPKEDGSFWPNTTVQETYYKVIQCRELHCTDTDEFDASVQVLPIGFEARGLIHGNNLDRVVATGMMLGTSIFIGPQGDGGWAQRGSFVFELFQVLVDLTLRDEDWTVEVSTDIVSISSVYTTNFTVIPGVKKPVFNPPQDFYSGPLNVTLDTHDARNGSNASVFFTLQPPFIYDEDGTWCPNMGSWCENSPGGDATTFHAVPNQPPNFIYSARGLFVQMYDVPYAMQMSVEVPEIFPFNTSSEALADSAALLGSDGLPVEGVLERLAYSDALVNRTVNGSVTAYTKENVTLFPLYTFQKVRGMWLLFEPRVNVERVEDFHLDVSTCSNQSVQRIQTLNGSRIESVRTMLGTYVHH